MLLVAGAMFLSSCSSDDDSFSEGEEPIPEPEEEVGTITGFYLLNEGAMTMNKASLDRFDYTTGEYESNIFSEANPEEVGGLGDVGNDLGIYGSKMYIVVNASNKVEVLDVKTGKRLKQLDVKNGRYITFYEGKAYLSSYTGAASMDNGGQGIVAEIDTTSLEIVRSTSVGRQPEELAAYGGRIYVANSGGYSPPDYETTISVIDIESFEEVKRIEVAENLHRLKIDKEGDLYVSSRGDYFDIPAKLFVIDTETEQIKKSFDLAVSDMAIHNNKAYIFSNTFSYETYEFNNSYHILDVESEELLEGSFITDGTEEEIETPYEIAINPETEEILITDAKDYLSPGSLYYFNSDGTLKWEIVTGDIPGRIAFIKE